MHVRVERVDQTQPELRDQVQIPLGTRAHRIDQQRFAAALIGQQIRIGRGICVDQLSQQHTRVPPQPIAATCSTWILYNTRTSPGRANGYLSLPRYFFAILSMCSDAPRWVTSTTRPRI